MRKRGEKKRENIDQTNIGESPCHPCGSTSTLLALGGVVKVSWVKSNGGVFDNPDCCMSCRHSSVLTVSFKSMSGVISAVLAVIDGAPEVGAVPNGVKGMLSAAVVEEKLGGFIG